MNKKIVFLVIAYTVLNFFTVAFPQQKVNKELKQQLTDTISDAGASSENLSIVNDMELIESIEELLKSADLKRKSYTYTSDERELTQAHKLRVNLSGTKSGISDFIGQLNQIDGLQLDELILTQNGDEIDANINIIVIGVKDEKQVK